VISAQRESLRIKLDQAGTPDDAPARRMLARADPVFAYDLDHRLRVDNCEVCGAIHWRDCVCDPSAPRAAPTPAQIDRSRALRLVRAELPESDGQ
jgi:hypothetical protein